MKVIMSCGFFKFFNGGELEVTASFLTGVIKNHLGKSGSLSGS